MILSHNAIKAQEPTDSRPVIATNFVHFILRIVHGERTINKLTVLLKYEIRSSSGLTATYFELLTIYVGV